MQTKKKNTLWDNWHSLVNHEKIKIKSVEKEKEWFEVITKECTKENRFYHNLNHLQELYTQLDRFRNLIQCEHIVELCIFFHDVIYDPKSATNEEDSSDMFLHFSKDTEMTNEDIEKVKKYILQTKSHLNCKEIEDVDLIIFLDMDLSILGSEPDRYQSYMSQVRNEYSHFDDDTFQTKRLQFLKYLSQHSNLYFHSESRKRFESKARENIANEINLITQKLQKT